jgi:hypothetical protein
VSWNPSLNRNETFPTRSWTDEAIVDFFRTRFDHSDQASQTWREMRGIASRLLGKEPKPGVDYAVTDAVRCKSVGGEGASKALAECTSLYLRRTIEASGARVIVALGKDARSTMAAYFGVPAELGGVSLPKLVGGYERILVQLGAPGSAETRSLAQDELLRVRTFLGAS